MVLVQVMKMKGKRNQSLVESAVNGRVVYLQFRREWHHLQQDPTFYVLWTPLALQ